MPNGLLKFFGGVLLLFLSARGNASITIDLKQHNTNYYFIGESINYFEDSSRTLSFSEVLLKDSMGQFSTMKEYPIEYLDPNKVYWIRLDLQNTGENLTSQWVIEFLDFRIGRLDVYLPNNNGGYFVKTAGFSYPASQKEFKHKNYVFQLPLIGNKTNHVYARMTSRVPVTARVKVSTIQNFTEYTILEYFFLALYYGICLSMLIYNFFLFVTIQDKTYRYYIFYVFGAILFSFSRDGLGFLFVWPEYPIVNTFIFNFSNLFMIFWEVMYVRSFLNLSKTQPNLDRVLRWALAIRVVLYFCTMLFFPQLSTDVTSDIIILLIAFYAGIQAFKNNYKPAYYYLLAFILMLTGYIIFAFVNLGLVTHNIFTIYSVNFGIVGEMLFLSFALASRIKILQREKIQAQNETIKQLVVNEDLKDSLNKDLEKKVKERTHELEAKNKELDAFVYKASHDLKGPLNSIVGLATIGMMEDDTSKMKEYFRLTRETAKRLQSTIVDLLSLTKVKETTVNKRPLDVADLLDDVIDNFAHDDHHKHVVIQKNVEIDRQIVSDESLIKSILQNLIENGLKYSDPRKEKQTLDISLKGKNGQMILKVRDNGLGIPANAKERVFDMFYKINPKSMGSGLGLHILKTAVQKLGGTIELESEIGKGSTFIVKLPNES